MGFGEVKAAKKKIGGGGKTTTTKKQARGLGGFDKMMLHGEEGSEKPRRAEISKSTVARVYAYFQEANVRDAEHAGLVGAVVHEWVGAVAVDAAE